MEDLSLLCGNSTTQSPFLNISTLKDELKLPVCLNKSALASKIRRLRKQVLQTDLEPFESPFYLKNRCTFTLNR